MRLPRFVTGAAVGDGLPHPKDTQQQLVEAARREYFEALPQHATDRLPPDGGSWGSCTLLVTAHYDTLRSVRPVEHRIGNRASCGLWGGDPIPPPPPLTEEEVARCMAALAPVPYDMPALPTADIPGLEEVTESWLPPDCHGLPLIVT